MSEALVPPAAEYVTAVKRWAANGVPPTDLSETDVQGLAMMLHKEGERVVDAIGPIVDAQTAEIQRLRRALVDIRAKAREYCSCTNADIELGEIVDMAIGAEDT